jgi:hypothetical protein
VHWADLSSATTSWVVLALLLLVAALLAVVLRDRLRVARVQARARHGRRAEERALRRLQRAGYEVLEQSPERRYDLSVDGVPREIRLVADLLVERRGRRFVADVKTGDQARPAAPDTRRQLLEYLLAFDVDGALLVNPDTDEIVEVAFPWDDEP